MLCEGLGFMGLVAIVVGAWLVMVAWVTGLGELGNEKGVEDGRCLTTAES